LQEAKVKKESQYEEDYEPEWMKNDSQGYAIGRRIYEKSEIEVRFLFCSTVLPIMSHYV